MRYKTHSIARRALQHPVTKLGVAILMCVSLMVQPAAGVTLYWDPDTADSLNNVDGTNLGGTGNWDTSTSNWWNTSALTLWPNTSADTGIFSGPVVLGTPTANTVTLSSGITANQLRFVRSGYTLTGGNLTLAGTTPTLHANLGESVTINSQILGTAGLTKTGGGSIRLGNALNSYTGVTTIANGSLIISDPAALGGTGTVSILTNNNTPLNTASIGFAGGSLVLDGTTGGFTFARDIDFEGRGPIGERGSAILSLGNNTLSGILRSAISPLPLSPTATIRNSRINSVNGTLTVSGTVNAGGTSATTYLNFGGVNAAGVGNYTFGGTGTLTGTGSIEKSGGGTLFLNSLASNAGFTGTIRISGSATGTQSSVRVTDLLIGGNGAFGGNTGTGTSSVIDLNGGVLEFRSDSDLNFGALASGKNVYNRSGGIVFTGPAAGGAAINGTTTLGALQHVVSTTASTATTTFNSRNGYGVTLSTMAMDASTSSSTLTNTLTNSMGGNLTFTGNITLGEGSTASRPRVLAIGGNGNTVIQGSVIAGTDTGKSLTKSGSGNLTIVGVGTTVAGTISVTGGAITATDFRSLNNNTADISLGNAGTTAGHLIIGGVGTPTLAGLTTSKTITLNTTTASPSIYANQTGVNPVVLNGAITRTTQTTGGLILGGSNTADNIINVAIPSAGTTGGLTKIGAGTWVLNAENAYLGATTIQNGTLKLRATAAASDVIDEASGNTIVFSGNTTTGTAGGTLEFKGFSGAATTETLGALTPTAGAATVALLGNTGSAANLIFTSLGATTAASSLNFNTTGANGGLITLTGQSATSATNLPGSANFQGHLYINGADFATINGSAQVVAPTYAASGNFQNAAGALVATVHNKLTGSFTNAAATVSSLVTNSQTLTMSGNLTVSTGAILQSGGTGSFLSDSGTSREIRGGAAATNIAFRVNESADVLNIGSATNPMHLGSFTTGGLTKNGEGKLVFFGTNAQTGTTNINEGTVQLSGASARISATSASLVIRQGAILELNGTTAANATVNALDGAGIITNVNTAAATFTQTGSGTWAGVFQDGAGVLNVTKAGTTGAPTWTGLNTYTGVTTIGGTTGSVTVDFLANGGQSSAIGASSSAASNLVFSGTTAGIIYRGSTIEGALTLGSRSASTDRLFTLSGTGATLSSTVTNNNAIVWSNTGAIVHGIVGPQSLILTGSSTGDNTFNPQITDSGTGANITSVTKSDVGQWNLGNSNNTYTGATAVQNGILALNNAGALPANSPLVLGSSTTSGILQTSGTFARNLTTTPTAGTGTITWGGTTGGGGFAAHSTPLTVTLNSGAGLTWGSGGFVPTGASLIFNSASALSDVTFTNAIDLGAAVRTITVNDNGNTGADYATLTGILSGTGGALLKNGSGILRLTGANTYTGTTEVQAGTIVVSSLGSSTGAATSGVGAGGVTMDNTNAIVLGNASTTGGILQYVGAGETSDRKIRLRGTTASNQIHADGSGPLILTNVAHDTTETGDKTLSLRGSNTAGNLITSALTNNGAGVLSVTVDGGATWILTGTNSFTGNLTASGGALGIGDNAAVGAGTLVNSNGNIFAYGADRTITNAVTLSNNATNGWLGDYSLTFTGANNFAAGANNITTNNSIVAGKALTFQGLTANSLTATRAWTIDGPGETVINGDFTTSTAFGVNITKTGNGTLTLGTNGATSNWNQLAANIIDVDRGTLKFTTNNAIPTLATSGGITLSPELATTDTATVDLNGTAQTINALTATSDGTIIIDNTSGTAASLTFGANNTAVSFGTGTGTYTITDSGAGALSIFKAGNTSTTIPAGVTLTYQGTTGVTGGSMTIASPVNGSSGLSVTNSGSTLTLSGGITNASAVTSIVVENGGTLNLTDAAGSQFANLATLTLGSSGGSMTTLGLNVGDLSTPGDELNTDLLSLLASGTLNLFTGNKVTLNLTDAGLNPGQTYDLLTFSPGGFTSGPLSAGDWLLGATPGGFSSISLTVNNDRIFITTGTLITGSSYWNGTSNTTWNVGASNWSQDKAGTIPALSIPGQGTDVIFQSDAATTGAVVTTLEQNFKINSLSFEAATIPANTPTSIAINPGTVTTNRLEIAPQLPSGGIAITTGGTPSVTISAPLKLGANQTWNVADAASVLTLSGGLLGEKDVTKAGAGKVVLSAAADSTFNTGLTSDFTINGGNLEITSTGALGTTVNANLANVIVNSTGGFYYNNATAGTVANPITLAGGTLSGGGNNHTYSGTVNISGASFINMADSNGPATNTARNITLSGVVSGSGALTVSSNTTTLTGGNPESGTFLISNAASTWSGALTLTSGTVDIGVAASPTVIPSSVTFDAFGRLIVRGVNGQTYNQSGPMTFTAGTIGEYLLDNTSGTLAADFVVNQNGQVNIGSGGIGASARFTVNDAATRLNIAGGVVLGGNSSISVDGGDADSFTTISGVISDGGSGYSLAINDDAGGWAVGNDIIRLTGLNTFTGNLSLTEGILEFNTVTNISGGASSLGNGTAISMTGGTLRFIGTSAQSTDRPISTTTGAVTLSVNGATAADTITYNGVINVGPTGDGTQITLTGATGSEGIIGGGITLTGDSADMTVNGGTWTHQTGTSRVGDTMSVTGTGTILNLNSGLFQVRNDLTVTANAVLNLNGTGVLSFNTATLSSDASLLITNGGVVNLGANDAVVATEFDRLFIGQSAGGAVATLNMGTFNLTTTRLILGERLADRTGMINGTGALTVTGGDIDLYDGAINANLITTGSGTFEKFGPGTVTLSGDNSGLTSTGITILNEGTLALDYLANNATKLRAASQLEMRGGDLTLSGNASAATSQAVASLTLDSSATDDNAGANRIVLTSNGQDILLNVGAITRANGNRDGTLRLVLPSGTQSATNGVITSTTNTNGLLGGAAYATVTDNTGTWFATNSTNTAGGNIVGLSSTSNNSVVSWLDNDHITDETTGFFGSVSAAHLNSLRFNAIGGSNLNLTTTGVLSIASGGLLVTDQVTGSGASILAGTLASGTGELIITQDSAQTLTISADIRVHQGVTKAGTGTLLLSGSNTYTDETEILEGTLQVSGGNGIGDTSIVTLAASRPSSLVLLASETIGRLNGGRRNDNSDYGTVDIGTNTLTLNHTGGNTNYAGFLVGTGSIVMSSLSTTNQAISGVNTGFTGSVVVNGGLFQLVSSGQLNASSFTVNKGGSLLIDNNGTTRSGTRILDTTPIFLNSADGTFGGQTIVRGLSIRIDQNAATNETIGNLVFNSGASYLSGDASGTTGRAAIIADNFTRNNAATVNVRARNLGLAAGDRNNFRIGTTANETAFIAAMVGDVGVAGTQNIKIVPWAIGEQTSASLADTNMGNSLVTYDVGNGFRALNFTTEYDTLALAAATDNARESLTADLTGLIGTTVNALVLNNNNTAASTVNVTGTGAGQALAVTSGALLFTLNPAATGAHSIVLGGFDNGITVGGTNEYVFHVVNPSSAASPPTLSATITSPLTSTADITKAGRGTLVLTASNTAGGGTRKTTINEGILEIADLDNIGGSTGALVFAGGTLRLSNSPSPTYSGDDLSLRTITLLQGGGTIDTNGLDLALAGSVGSGLGGLTKAGLGNLTLNAAAAYTGSTNVNGGTLTVGADNATGNGGDLNIGGGATLALGIRSISHGLVSTSGASPLITGTGTINASSAGFSLNHTGDTTIDAILAGLGGLIKAQTNIVTLTAASTYKGTTEVRAGTLAFNSIGNVNGGASALGNPATAEAGILRMGLTTAATTLIYTGSGHSTDRIIGMQGTTGSVTLDADGTGAIVFNAGARFEFPGNKTLVLRGSSDISIENSIGQLKEIGGVMTLNKTDANTWLLTAANTYTGATQVDNGILRIGLDNALPTTTAVRIGTGTTAGTLDLNGFNQTIGSLTVQTTTNAVTNNIIVDTGKTLTINGAVTLGVNANAATTAVTASGGGSIVVNSAGANFQIGGATGSTNDNSVNVDFSGLSNFTANLGSGTFRLGDVNSATDNNPSNMKLAVNNTLTAASIRIGDSSGGGVPTTHTLTLGSGTNIFNSDLINVGSAGTGVRSGGALVFDGLDTTGTLSLRASDGVSRTTLNIINTTGSTAGNMESTINLAGHTSDILVGTLTMASRSASTGAATATMTFDQGTLDITTLIMASRTGAGTGNAAAIVNLGDSVDLSTPMVTIGTINMAVNTSAGGTVTSDLNITGGNVTIGTGSGTAINMANAGTGRTVTSNIALTGGSVSITGNVVRTGGAGTENATLMLNGASLNMNGSSIGTLAAGITLAAQSGTLTNLAELNGGGVLTKSTAGTLTLGNGNTYTGGTAITGGTLLANNTTGSATGTGAVSVTGGTLGGNGTIAGNTSVNAGGILAAGSAANTAGTITLQGNLAMAGSGSPETRLSFDFTNATGNAGGEVSLTGNWWSTYNGVLLSGNGSQSNDLINLTATTPAITWDTGGTVSLNQLGSTYNWMLGDILNLMDWNNVGNANPITGSFGTALTDFDLPTLGSGLSWDTSRFMSTGAIAVTPEPGRVLLLMFGLLALFFRRRR